MIKIIGVGTIKEEYIKKAINLKIAAIQHHQKIEIISVNDEKCPENLSEKEKAEVKRKEGEKILRFIKDEDYVVALTLEGPAFEQNKFKKQLQQDRLCFIIGGSLGLAPAVIQRANQELSFGAMTYPHQLMRWVLLEQIATALIE